MELERDQTFFHSFDLVVDTTLFREETTEAIVPDACPDILNIIETEGNIFLTSKNTYDGRGDLSGEIRAAVLYLPDGEAGVRHLDVTLPFNCAVEHSGITGNCCMTAMPCLRSIEARPLNPRKILIRAEAAVSVSVRAPRETQILSGLICEACTGIQQKTEQKQNFLTVCVEEKSFQFSDNLKFSSEHCDELLKARALPVHSEAKIIGNKLIFKGEVRLETVYRSGESLETARFELPFSQIMEVSNAGEESVVTLHTLVTDLVCVPEGEGGSGLSVSMTLLAQALVEEERVQTVVQDVYSTSFELSSTAVEFPLRRLIEAAERPMTLRTLLETSQQVQRVIDCHVTVGQAVAGEEEGKLTLSAPITLYALCQGENDALFQVTETVPAVCQFDQPAGGTLAGSCACVGEIYASPAAGGMEARVPLCFQCSMTATQQFAVIDDITLDEEHPRCSDGMPSIILRPVMEGERLWDVAKSCFTTIDELVQANDLTEGEALCGRMLLIPKRR